MKIPFVNLEAQYTSIAAQLQIALSDAISSFKFIQGDQVKKFEAMFSLTLASKHCVAAASGTDALFIGLKCLGIGQGDEVIVPAFTWISSSEVVSLCGATPVFVDVDEDTYTIDPDHLEEKITSKTKAVIVVHLYGQAADLIRIAEICKIKNLLLIEDSAQAHLTEDNGKKTGTFGKFGAFSFYPTKNLGAFGDAGCLTTDDDELALKARRFANHGALCKDDHQIEGINSRMDTIQAAVLLAKLPHLSRWNRVRAEIARMYDSELSNLDEVVVPFVRPKSCHTFHIYAIRAQQRDALKQFLLEKGVQTMIHYPRALHNLPAYRHLHHKGNDFPVSQLLQDEILSLPVYPELKQDEVYYICQKIKAFYQK